jgi:hypothetical protein
MALIIDMSTERRVAVIPIVPLGLSLGLFFVISYLACIGLYLLLPSAILNHAMLTLFLPGFELLDWRSFLLGLVESFGYGWYVALIFGPLYNFFALRRR